MTKKIALLKARFVVNMERINGLATLLFSDIDQLKPTGFAQYEGVSADIMRLTVVFLHANFEMLVRGLTHQPGKKWSFYSAADIDRALRRSAIDPKPFKFLYPPLTQLAKRRKRIVHDADFSKPTDTFIEKWNIVDYWQLCMWNLAVLAFYYRLLISANFANEREMKKYDGLKLAITAHVNFGNQLIAFPKALPEKRVEALQKMIDTLETISRMLGESNETTD